MALAWYAPGLVFVGISRVVAPTFYALQDTRTPVWVSFWTLLVSIVASLLLMQPMRHAGLALALTLSSVFNALVLLWLLDRRLQGIALRSLLVFTMRLIPGLLVMSLVAVSLLGLVDWQVKGVFWQRLLLLLTAVGGGGTAYLAGCWLCRVSEVNKLLELVMARVARRRQEQSYNFV